MGLLVCKNRSEVTKSISFLVNRYSYPKFVLFYQSNNAYVWAAITNILLFNLPYNFCTLFDIASFLSDWS